LRKVERVETHQRAAGSVVLSRGPGMKNHGPHRARQTFRAFRPPWYPSNRRPS